MAVHQSAEIEKLIALESLQPFGMAQPGAENKIVLITYTVLQH